MVVPHRRSDGFRSVEYRYTSLETPGFRQRHGERRRSRIAATATIATTIAAASMYVAISGTGISKTRRESLSVTMAKKIAAAIIAVWHTN
jgi:hypothetical protein